MASAFEDDNSKRALALCRGHCIRQTEPIHCGLVEEIVVRGENPRTRKRSVAQDKLAEKGFIKANDRVIAVRECAVGTFKEMVELLLDRLH